MMNREGCGQSFVMTRNIGLAAAVVCVLTACAGTTVDLGGKADGGGGSGSSSGSSGSSSGSTSPPNPFSGTYTGYIESFTFPDGSDAVTMALTFGSSTSVTGTVFFGDSPALPAPIDPNVGYPPGYADSPTYQQVPLEGFAFTILDGNFSAPRLRLQVQVTELWKKWCEIQTTIYPMYDEGPDGGCDKFLGYGCLPEVGRPPGNFPGCEWASCSQGPTPIDCGKYALCGGGAPGSICSCTHASCTVVPSLPPQFNGSSTISFDMQLPMFTLDGSVTGLGSGNVYNVHLTKAP